MSFSLWPSSSISGDVLSSASSGNTKLSSENTQLSNADTHVPTPVLNFIHVLYIHRLEVSLYEHVVKHFDTSAPVGSGRQAIVELSNMPGVVIKRTRRFDHRDSNHVTRFDKNLARLMLEVRILTLYARRGLDHFVKVIGVCFEKSVASPGRFGEGEYHLLLEYSELGDLASFLGRHAQQLDMEVKTNLAYQVSHGLNWLHLDRICHGDLKVQNVLVFNGKDGRYIAKLADFGLSVHGEFRYSWEGCVSHCYYPAGTPLLNAPEVRNGNSSARLVYVDDAIRAEVFSFGLLIWEILKDGHSYFDTAWLDLAQVPKMEPDMEEQMAFLSNLSHNELLTRGVGFLMAQDLDGEIHEQILQVFHASLQDDPMQRWPMSRIQDTFRPPSEKNKLASENLAHAKNGIFFPDWSTRRANEKLEFLDYTCLNLPHSLQRRALDELVKLCASPSSVFLRGNELRRRAALNLAECHLISFGTGYDAAGARYWLEVEKWWDDTSSLCLRRISEALGPPPDFSEGFRRKRKVIPDGTKVEYYDNSELFLMRKVQSRIASAITRIRALSNERQSWLHASYVEVKEATSFLCNKIGSHIVGSYYMTTLDIAALLGEDEIMVKLLPTIENFKACGNQLNVLHCACVGGNVSALEYLLDYGIDSSLCGCNDITALHLLIYMPAELVDRAVNLLIAYGTPTGTRSKATPLVKMDFDLVGTPIEWAVLARHRSLVTALLPHSKGQEKSILQHAISHAYYEIVEDLLSKEDLSGLFTKEDCPTLSFSRAFKHLIIHGRNGDLAIERTIQLCHAYDLIDYEEMLKRCMASARTQSCLKALEVLMDLCPASIVRQGLLSSDLDTVGTSIPYTAFLYAGSNPAWRPVLEVMLRNFSIAELDDVEGAQKCNLFHLSVTQGWTVAVRVLLEKGMDARQTWGLHVPLTSFDLAIQKGDIEMQAILSEYCDRTGFNIDHFMRATPHTRELLLQCGIRHQALEGFVHCGAGDKNASIAAAVSKAHESLCCLLTARDEPFGNPPEDPQLLYFHTLRMDAFRALISNQLMTGLMDMPDKNGVTLLQRAAAALDGDMIRLLLEAGADANVPFLATKRVNGEENDRSIPILPLQIIFPVFRSLARQFESGLMKPKAQSDAVSPWQAFPATTNEALPPQAKYIESIRAKSLSAAQELLRWHLLRNDPRFEGITDIHLSCSLSYVSCAMELYRPSDPEDAKVSCPGEEGQYKYEDSITKMLDDEMFLVMSNMKKLHYSLEFA